MYVMRKLHRLQIHRLWDVCLSPKMYTIVISLNTDILLAHKKPKHLLPGPLTSAESRLKVFIPLLDISHSKSSR